MANKITNFFKNAFKDMGESAKKQHEIDKANFEAEKYESSITVQKQVIKEEQEQQLAKAIKRKDEAKAKYEQAKNN